MQTLKISLIEKQQVLDGLKEAVDDVKNNRVSKIDTLWDSIDKKALK